MRIHDCGKAVVIAARGCVLASIETADPPTANRPERIMAGQRTLTGWCIARDSGFSCSTGLRPKPEIAHRSALRTGVAWWSRGVPDPDVSLDTNHLKRALRVIPMARKNWKICWTELGAKHVGSAPFSRSSAPSIMRDTKVVGILSLAALRSSYAVGSCLAAGNFTQVAQDPDSTRMREAGSDCATPFSRSSQGRRGPGHRRCARDFL